MADEHHLRRFARQMRKEPTPAEKTMWRLLRTHRMVGFPFRRQHPIGPYILDFYCPSAAVVVELDGDSHTTPEGRSGDETRTAYLTALGLHILRFWNFDVHDDPDAVADHVYDVCSARRGHNRRRTPGPDRQPRTRSTPRPGSA